jgi:predicted nuclease of predicted toxin-antitoxin system
MGSRLSAVGESRLSYRTSDRGVDRLLIDECLSQGLLAVAKERGFHADHVVWLGKSGTQDWNLVPFALDHDYAFVTNNRRDFMREYARLSAHAGLIILVPMVERDEQIRLFGLLLDHIQSLPDTVNKLVEIFSDGEIRVRDWSAFANDRDYASTAGRPA